VSQRYQSVAEMFLARVAATPDREALRYPVETGWSSLTWQQVGDRVRAIACGLRALGLQDEQRVSILSNTRYEWILVDCGIMCAGGATTTIYPSSTDDDCAYIIADSATVICVAENDGQVQKLQARRKDMPKLHHVVVIDGKASADGWVLTLADLEAKGRDADQKDPTAYEKIARSVQNKALATLIYTSGTTGRPKGVELTHDNWLYEGEGIEELGLLDQDDLQYLWLPLSHSFGKVLLSAQLRIGFASAVDGRIDKIVDNLGVVKPTFVGAVPRIFEKVHNKVIAGAKEGGGLKFKIFKWAFNVGREVSKLRQEGKQPGGMLAFKNSIADKLVFSKLKNRFGGRLKYFVSGSAPLSREIAEFFHAADILILEGYGLTESSAAAFVNRPGQYRFGTVGPALPGTEIKIAEDGEILIRGRNIMRGYHNLTDATKETLIDGWLHTGDIGHVESGGFLKITDRKKDLIKTSGGKYVAPQSLEGKLKLACPIISQVVVHGDNRNFCSALITLDDESAKKWANDNGKPGQGAAQLCKDPAMVAVVQAAVDEMNKSLAKYETIKRFEILPADFTQ
jgi:long-chain acyl-CoA synthetase